MHFEHIEDGRCGHDHLQALRRIQPGKVRRLDSVEERALEALARLGVVSEVRDRHRRGHLDALPVLELPEDDELFLIGPWKRVDQEPVEQREHAGIRRNAQSE